MEPTFKEYEIACRLRGATVKHFHLPARKGFLPSLPSLIRAIRGVDLVWLCNPNNPTGSLMPPETIRILIQHCRRQGVLLVVDESFLLFHPRWRQLSCIPEAVSGDGVLVLQSLTKFYCIPGLRIGCGIGNQNLVNRLARCQPPWHVNGIAQAAAGAAFQSGEYALRTVATVQEERDWLVSALSGLHLVRRVYPSAADFLLVELQPPATAPGVWEQLARLGVLVRDCSNFGWLGDRFIRVAVKDRMKNALLLERLKTVDKAHIKMNDR
jgi:threonine-phosphate decarboxylase